MSRAGQADHEAMLVKAFVIPQKRTRLVTLLASPKKRPDVLGALAHFVDLDPRFRLGIRPGAQSASAIEQLLKGLGAPSDCYVISENRELDQGILPLGDALAFIVGRGMGALLSCVPGRLGYYEGEEKGDRCILHRRAA